MKYTVNHITESLEPYYMGPGKSDPTQTFRSEVKDTYVLSSDEQFEKLVKDATDSPDYELTEENVTKWWSPSGEKLSGERLSRIMSYYGGREGIKDKILSDADSFRKGTDKIFTGTYDIPEGSRWFSTEDHDEYAPMLSRESIWITIERN